MVSAGILLDQLEKVRGIPFLALPGLIRIPQFLAGLRRGVKPTGQTPNDLLAGKLAEAEKAAAEAELASASATRRKADAERIASDARAVVLVARMEASLGDFRQLTTLTKTTYDSLSDVPIWNPMRFKPDICPYHWSDVLP